MADMDLGAGEQTLNPLGRPVVEVSISPGAALAVAPAALLHQPHVRRCYSQLCHGAEFFALPQWRLPLVGDRREQPASVWRSISSQTVFWHLHIRLR